MPLRFNMLLSDAGIDASQVRLLRHQTKKINGRTPYSLWRDNLAAFEEYQSTQSSEKRTKFKASYWATFVVPPKGGTLFVGLYQVTLKGTVPMGTPCPLSREQVGGNDCLTPYDQYQYVRMDALSEYIGRLSIDWGPSPISWVQKAEKQNKEIIELTPNFREEDFPGFTKFTRPLSEIENMPPTWKAILKINKGVYLLACPRTQKHYVGSAYGIEGFWGRWSNYSRNNHGNNLGMINHGISDYLVSILEVAASSASDEDILALEEMWKKKLFSQKIGLNYN